MNNLEKKYLIENFTNNRLNNKVESYVLGRYAIKKAVWQKAKNIDLKNIFVKNGILQQPILKNKNLNLDVTVSHCENYSIALAFDRDLIIGVDMEKHDRRKIESIKENIISKEIEMMEDLKMSLVEKLVIIWSIKESLSKCLKTGININLNILEINEIKNSNFQIEGTFLNFPQYKFLTFKYKEYIISITSPKHLNFRFNKKDL